VIYRFGGADNPLEALAYNIVDDEWIKLPDMPSGRHSATVVGLGDYIYVIGGNTRLRPNKKVERFHTKLLYWEDVTSLHNTRENASGAVINDKIYVFGGQSYSTHLSSVEIFNPYTNIWTIGPSIPNRRTQVTGQYIDGIYYLFGGMTSSYNSAPLRGIDTFY
jgi:N-acetylneuraminic acid mutarotase